MRFKSVALFGHSVAIFSILSGILAPIAFAGPIYDAMPGRTGMCDLSVAKVPEGLEINPTALKEINSLISQRTPMWAQEAIGGPESLQFLIDLHQKKPLFWVPIGISDGNFLLKDLPVEKLNSELKLKRHLSEYSQSVAADNTGKLDKGEHAYSVTTLITDLRGFGTGYFSYLSWFSDGVNSTRLKQRTSEIESAEVIPHFVNRSVENKNPTLMDDSAEMIEVSKKAIVVVASGNQFPWPTDKGSYRSIVVGAVTIQGIMAPFSRHGANVDITAPGVEVLVLKKSGGLDLINGTSFAAPLVTGALSSVASILPGVSLEELKHMLKMTAIKTSSYSRKVTGDGHGVMNQFAMVRVADRLRSGWPQNRSKIYQSWPYDFQSEIMARKRLIQATPDEKTLGRCVRDRSLLQSLRQNFFLDPSDKTTRSALANLYSTNGYYLQAFYYQDPQTNLAQTLNLATILDQREFQIAVGAGDLERLKALKHTKLATPVERGTLLQIAASKGYTEILRFLIEDWGNLVISKEVRDEIHSLALRHRHDQTAAYIALLPISKTK